MIYHVSVNGCDKADGSKETPFRTINRAAAMAQPGDTVQVHEGVYREWVDPQNSGLSAQQPIIYEAAPGEHAVIKGSEPVTGWVKTEGNIWKTVLPNTMFGDWNPYIKKVEGDWLREPKAYDVHLGDVYLNGISMYEARSKEDLFRAEIRYSGFQVSPYPYVEPIRNPEQTVYQWYAQVDDATTTLFCNFQDCDPNKETVEINVRKCCFYPTQTGRNYIVLRGFEIAHGACPFTPPTADQVGMVGPHWSRGWIIENNDIHHAKCSGISLGKDVSMGNNECMLYHKKHSHYYQTEAVFLGLRSGWNKETVGSHIVRNNVIHDCGQNAIVGHMGGAFSRIEHNHIYNIAVKHEFEGAEIAGIKLHAAIDVVIEGNLIHDCTRATWLDWQAQGARVTRNLYYNNDSSDLMIEVTHGPCTIDHNIFLSENSLENVAQGTAYVHNLFAGNAKLSQAKERDTPYHFPHSTEIKGMTKTFGGDDRLYNNLFLGQYPSRIPLFSPMSACFNQYEVPEVYYEKMRKKTNIQPLQPVWIDGNAYAGYASAFRAERSPIRSDGSTASVTEKNGRWILSLFVPPSVAEGSCEPVTTQRLGKPVFSEAPYENPDGTPLDLTTDYLGEPRGANVVPGPFAKLTAGMQQIVVWEK